MRNDLRATALFFFLPPSPKLSFTDKARWFIAAGKTDFKSCFWTNEVWLQRARIMDVSLRESGSRFHENRLPCCVCVCVMSWRWERVLGDTVEPKSLNMITQPPSGFHSIMANCRFVSEASPLRKITEKIETLPSWFARKVKRFVEKQQQMWNNRIARLLLFWLLCHVWNKLNVLTYYVILIIGLTEQFLPLFKNKPLEKRTFPVNESTDYTYVG